MTDMEKITPPKPKHIKMQDVEKWQKVQRISRQLAKKKNVTRVNMQDTVNELADFWNEHHPDEGDDA